MFLPAVILKHENTVDILRRLLSRDALDTVFAGYQISGRISGKGRIPDIRPDTWLDNYIFGKISNKFIKKGFITIDFCKH
jgi:riboflavin synthase alpha subunit